LAAGGWARSFMESGGNVLAALAGVGRDQTSIVGMQRHGNIPVRWMSGNCG